MNQKKNSFTRKLRSRIKPAKETCAITLDKPKTAALCFDRVYSSSLAETPAGIHPEYARFGNAAVWGTAMRAIRFSPTPETLALEIRNKAIPTMKGLRERGYLPVPYFSDTSQLRRIYTKEERGVLGLIIENMLTVEESTLSWPQVEQFRSDEGARSDYKRMLYWFDRTFSGRDVQAIQDFVGESYEKYTAAIKKHGIPVQVGSIESMSYRVLGAAGIAGAFAIGGLPALIGAAIGGLLFSTRNILLNSSAFTGVHDELAFIHRVNSIAK